MTDPIAATGGVGLPVSAAVRLQPVTHLTGAVTFNASISLLPDPIAFQHTV